MSFETKEVNGVLVARINEPCLDRTRCINTVGKQLLGAVDLVGDQRKLVVNFDGVEIMTSAMLGQLVTFHKHCKRSGVAIKLCCLAPHLREIMEITNLHRLFDIAKDDEQAIESFTRPKW